MLHASFRLRGTEEEEPQLAIRPRASKVPNVLPIVFHPMLLFVPFVVRKATVVPVKMEVGFLCPACSDLPRPRFDSSSLIGTVLASASGMWCVARPFPRLKGASARVPVRRFGNTGTLHSRTIGRHANELAIPLDSCVGYSDKVISLLRKETRNVEE